MSNSGEPPKRTLIGQDSPFESDDDPADTARQPVAVSPVLETTLPMGSTASLREAVDKMLAEGPAAAARIQAGRNAIDPASTTPMGSAAIEHAAKELPQSPKGPLAFTARGTAPSTQDIAEAIAKAANAHAERTKTPTGQNTSRDSDPSMPRKPTKPGTPGTPVPAVARTPTPGVVSNPAIARTPSVDSNPAIGQPDPSTSSSQQPMSYGAPTPSNAAISTLGYGAPLSNPTSLPADSMFARQKPPTGPTSNPQIAQPPTSDPRIRPPTGPNPAVFTAQPPTSDPRVRPPTGPNPAVDPSAFAPGRSGGTDPTALDMQAPQFDDTRRPPTGPNPAVDPAAYRPPTGPNPAVDPNAYRPPTGPNPAVDPAAFGPGRGGGTDPTAINMQAPTYETTRRPPTGPNPVDPNAHRPPTGVDPSAYPARMAPAPYPLSQSAGGTESTARPLAIATAQGHSPTDARAKPPTGPNPAVDPNAFAPKPGSNPNAAAYGATPGAAGYPQPPAYQPPAYQPPPAYGQPPPYVQPSTAALPPPAAYDFNQKPGSNPAAAAYDPAHARPPTNPNPNIPTYPAMVKPHDATMMASPASQAGQLSPAAERPRVSTDPMKPIAETLREVAVENYEIKNEIARGGMGRILRANDLRLKRQVAIKELVGDNAHFKARFERETLITARLQHPAIVPIYDAGRWPTGELFYTMKLVAGKPLETIIDNVAGMSERLALVPNMIAVAEALAYAHSNNVVHRDLKPANILIGDFGETIVIDWGLAKDLTTNEAAEPAGPFRAQAIGAMGATVAGSVMGTPAYMPVEQGRGLQVDARADVYAIGAVLYHVLGKRAPYEGPDGMTILQALLKEPPPPLTELAPDVPPELATIVAKAMAREPEHRYPTARELVEDLRRYQTGQMVGVHRYTSRELFRRWAKKHKGALTVATFAFVALVVVGIIAISRVVAANREAQHEAAVALEQTEAAKQALARAETSEARAKKSEQTAAEERDRQRFARERRVEFDHFAHTQRVSKCAECHPTDPKTFTAMAGHPGHAECVSCHEAKSMEGMSNDPKCAFCHIDRVATTKDHVSLRACDAGSIRAITATGGKVGPCFKHDSKSHRFADDGKPLECTTCHAVLADKTKWGTKSYRSLTDLDTNTIIGQGAGGGVDSMHKACTTGCHAHDAETGRSTATGQTACTKCHPSRDTF